MSSDSEFEPTPPKHRRLTRSLMSSGDDSGGPVVRLQRGGLCNKLGTNNEDVIVLSDIDNAASSHSGSASFGTRSNSESPTPDILKKLDDLEKTSEQSSEGEINVEKAASSSTGVESDSNDSQAEKCPICWLPFTNQEVATPSTCDHRFCFHCLMEWSKTTNTCPVDRQVYNDINVRPKFGSKVTRLVTVETRVSADTDDGEDRELDSDEDDYDPEDDFIHNPVVYRSSDELDTAPSSEEEDVDNSFICIRYQSSSADENDAEENQVVVLSSSSDEDVYPRRCTSSSSEYNEVPSPSSTPSPVYFDSDLSTPPELSPAFSPCPSPATSLSSSSSSSPLLSSSPALSPSPPPSPSLISLSSCSSVSSDSFSSSS